jgi:osmotically-inducible protein OsmY
MTTNETPSNIELQSTVTAALERSAAVESTLGVSAHEGVVTLSGSVTDAAERTAARAIAQQVPGVNMVSDEIAHPYRGSPPSPHRSPTDHGTER